MYGKQVENDGENENVLQILSFSWQTRSPNKQGLQVRDLRNYGNNTMRDRII